MGEFGLDRIQFKRKHPEHSITKRATARTLTMQNNAAPHRQVLACRYTHAHTNTGVEGTIYLGTLLVR